MLYVGLSQPQTISVQRLDNQPFFIYHQGHGRIQKGYYYYIHHFNLDSFKTQIQSLKFQFKSIENNQFTNLIISKFNDIDSSIKSLLPVKRVKRWDSVGTAWKYLAGNPDANDLRIINSSINSLISNNNEQVRINREISLQMKEALFKTKESIQLFNSKASELYSINIYLNLEFLYEKLNQIKETVMLARIGLLNDRVLSPAEIDLLVKDLARENITVWNTAEALTYATTSIVTNELDIALLIKLPMLEPKIYRKIFILPTWFEHQQIFMSNNHYLNHENKYYIVHSLKPKIFETKDITPDETACVPNLLTGKPAKCIYLDNPIEEVVSIDEQHVFTNLQRNFTIHTTCGLPTRNLTGTYLISFSNCEVTINNSTFSNQIQNTTGEPVHLPLFGIPIEKQRTVVNLSLEHLHNLHLETRKEMKAIRLNATSLQWPHWTVFGGLSVTPIIICAVFFLFLCLRGYKVKVRITQQELTPKDETTMETIRTEPHF